MKVGRSALYKKHSIILSKRCNVQRLSRDARVRPGAFAEQSRDATDNVIMRDGFFAPALLLPHTCASPLVDRGAPPRSESACDISRVRASLPLFRGRNKWQRAISG